MLVFILIMDYFSRLSKLKRVIEQKNVVRPFFIRRRESSKLPHSCQYRRVTAHNMVICAQQSGVICTELFMGKRTITMAIWCLFPLVTPVHLSSPQRFHSKRPEGAIPLNNYPSLHKYIEKNFTCKYCQLILASLTHATHCRPTII